MLIAGAVSLSGTREFPDQIFGVLPIPIIVVDGDGQISDANNAAEDFLQTSLPVLRRLTFGDLLPFDSPILTLID